MLAHADCPGATFHFVLPIAMEPTGDRNQSPLATALASHRPSILVLDDDDANGDRESPSIVGLNVESFSTPLVSKFAN
jgi:hypothetical protein